MSELNISEEIISLIESAEGGDPEAQFQLGQRYRMGLDVEQNNNLALEWYSKSAEQNYARGLNAMGQMYKFGLGVEINYTEAISWYKKAIEQEHPAAMCNMADMYERGIGIEINIDEAIFLYKKSASLGHVNAKYYLGWLYSNEPSLEKNRNEAVTWYSEAAEQGHTYAQFHLGLLYINGSKVDKDYEKAKELFQKAALQSSDAELRFDAIELQDLAERYTLSEEITNRREVILKKLRIITENTPTMTHYTSLQAGKKLLIEASPLRLGHINSLNDHNEGKLLWRYLGHESIEGKPAFVGCYLLDDDNLNMWRFYSKNHNNDDACGCAITFNTDNFFDFSLLPESSGHIQLDENRIVFSNTGKSPHESSAFYRIIYISDGMNIHDDKNGELKNEFSKLKDEAHKFLDEKPSNEKLQQLSRLLGPLPYLLKDADYEAEKEHRIIITHLEYGAKEIQTMDPILENGIPKTAPRLYLELHRSNHLDPIKHVTLGPKSPHQEMMAPYWHHKLASEFPNQLKAKPDFYVRTSRCAYK